MGVILPIKERKEKEEFRPVHNEIIYPYKNSYRSEKESEVKDISIAMKEKRMQSSILVMLHCRLPSQVEFENAMCLIQIVLKIIS